MYQKYNISPQKCMILPPQVFFFLPKKCIILGRGIPWLHPGFEKVYIFFNVTFNMENLYLEILVPVHGKFRSPGKLPSYATAKKCYQSWWSLLVITFFVLIVRGGGGGGGGGGAGAGAGAVAGAAGRGEKRRKK